MSSVRALAQLGVETRDPAAWRKFGTTVLGMQETPAPPGELRLRMDRMTYRLAVAAGDQDRLGYLAWEVDEESELAEIVARLEKAGYAVQEASREEAERRDVQQLLHTVDPGGYQVHLIRGALATTEPFASPTGSTFLADGLGVGHAVLAVRDYEAALHFYRDLLGMRLTDQLDLHGTSVTFLHCNPRHHSLALVDAGADEGMHHFMVELGTLDDVGHSYDRCLAGAAPVAASLGRHSNDGVVSFYAATPSGFTVEIGWGGLLVDDQSWRPARLTGPSAWGHHAVGATQ
ncbi:VOC family protein [Microtetraspora glauca]|uniref:VOC family protein n=1 Tax=Microtetraspora glauca TaxID=1996 RepID=A0ABV3GU62_MICGL